MAFETKNFDRLLGMQGLSEQLLKNHFALYQGYIVNYNKMEEILFSMLKDGKTAAPEYTEVKRRIAWEFNGIRLHEYYFENIKNGGIKLNKGSDLYKQIAGDLGNFEMWEKSFRAAGMMRGIGWIIAYYDPLKNKIINAWITEHDTGHLCGAIPLLVMDVFEHAYMVDYGIKKADYIDTFFKIIDWEAVNKRFNAIKSK